MLQRYHDVGEELKKKQPDPKVLGRKFEYFLYPPNQLMLNCDPLPLDFIKAQFGRVCLFAPETIYAHYLMNGKPPCKWCLKNDCLQRKGLSDGHLIVDRDGFYFLYWWVECDYRAKGGCAQNLIRSLTQRFFISQLSIHM